MVAAVLTIALAAVAGVVGLVLHELTHWVVARVAGRDPRIDWRRADTVWERGATVGSDQAALLAPFVVGLVAAGVWLGVGQPVTFPLVVGWAIYTVGGLWSDLPAALGLAVARPNDK